MNGHLAIGSLNVARIKPAPRDPYMIARTAAPKTEAGDPKRHLARSRGLSGEVGLIQVTNTIPAAYVEKASPSSSRTSAFSESIT